MVQETIKKYKLTYIFLLLSVIPTIYIVANEINLINAQTTNTSTTIPATIVIRDELAETNEQVQDNSNRIIATIVALSGLIGVIATLIPQIISLKRNVLGIKNERDEDIVRISQSVGQTDDWVLENLDKLRVFMGSTLALSTALNKIVTDNKDKLQLSEQELLRIKQELERISSILPPEKEIETLRTELSTNARDPIKIG